MSELMNTTAPAGWYPDPHGLPQQRWWAGDQWTHAVAPSVQQPDRAPQVTAAPTPRSAFALPATATVQEVFPTRRQLREQAAREAQAGTVDTHPAAPFEMPAAPVHAPAAVAPAPAIAVPAPAVVAPVPEPVPAPVPAPVAAAQVAPVSPPLASFAPPAVFQPTTFQPTIVPAETYASPARPVSAFPPPAAAQQVFVDTLPQPSWARPSAAAGFPPPNAAQPTFAPPQAAPLPIPRASPLAIGSSVPAAAATSWPFQTPQGGGFDSPADLPYQPFGMKQSVKAGVAAPPDRVQTLEAWVIAILPLVMAAVGILVVSQLGDFYTVFMQGGLIFIFALLTVVLAVRDRRALVAYGHSRTASPAFVLLTPLVYLVVRTIKVRGSAGRESAPLLVWLLSAAIIVALGFLFPEWLPRFAMTSGLF